MLAAKLTREGEGGTSAGGARLAAGSEGAIGAKSGAMGWLTDHGDHVPC